MSSKTPRLYRVEFTTYCFVLADSADAARYTTRPSIFFDFEVEARQTSDPDCAYGELVHIHDDMLPLIDPIDDIEVDELRELNAAENPVQFLKELAQRLQKERYPEDEEE